MVERTPVASGGTRALIEQARARRDALAAVDTALAEATGTAHDPDHTVEITVDARGALQRLHLGSRAVDLGPDRLGTVIVEVARAALREATQNGYNAVALRLGEDMTHLIERLSGAPAPARADGDDPGLTVEEFQRRRAERLRSTGSGAAGTDDGGSRHVRDADDLDSFDPSTLRSDR